jgi:hypothetical protein
LTHSNNEQSPRWLLTKDRVEEARVALQKLRSGTITDAEIDQEFDMLQLALQMEPEQGKFIELFKGVNRKRTAIVIGMNCMFLPLCSTSKPLSY